MEEQRIKELVEAIHTASVKAEESGELEFAIDKPILKQLFARGFKVTLETLNVDTNDCFEVERFEDKDLLEEYALEWLFEHEIDPAWFEWIEDNFDVRLKKYFLRDTFEDGHDDWDGGGWITHWARDVYASITFFLEEY